ncbi:hypothetical protein HK405_000639 [Cladochytrium tenue]|nr:hypothetical protein HK405_000639 [Cladochytrium tenue]
MSTTDPQAAAGPEKSNSEIDASDAASATLTVRLIRSFEYRTFKNVVLHGLDLPHLTPGDLKSLVQQKIHSEPGFKPYLRNEFDTLKVYMHAHGAKTQNLIINLDHDEDWILDDSRPLADQGVALLKLAKMRLLTAIAIAAGFAAATASSAAAQGPGLSTTTASASTSAAADTTSSESVGASIQPISSSSASSTTAAAVTTTGATTPSTTLSSSGGTLNSNGLPPSGTLALGGWLNWEEYPDSLDTPSAFNNRLGFRASSFQVRQSIPPIINDDGSEHLVDVSTWDDDTNAAVFFTVYADQTRNGLSGLDAITQADFNALATQLANITKTTGRAVIMRYCPEMNGDWMVYGAQPEKYVPNWIQMAKTFRSLAPEVVLVWSPNFDLNNPSQSVINNGGTYAGNYAPGSTYLTDSIQYVYSTYATPNSKPFVISEASAAWEVPLTGAAPANQVTQPEIQYDFWSQVFNAFTSGNYPLMVMAQIFEYTKPEDGFQRDFRVTWDSATRNRFVDSLQPLIDSSKVAWATGGNLAVSSSSSSSSKTSSASSTSAATVATSSSSTSGAVAASARRSGLAELAAVVCAVAGLGLVALAA